MPAVELLKELLDARQAYKNRIYPKFVFGNGLENEIPIFVYHKVRCRDFETQMRYLVDNGYETLLADEFHELITGNSPKKSRKIVLLSFDDGFSNFYDVAFPVLIKYNLKAVLYVIPNWVGEKGMLTWAQIDEISRSGLVDFQSHSLSHPKIFIDDRIQDFWVKKIAPADWNSPIRFNYHGMFNSENGFVFPIFQTSSRFSDHRRYMPNKEFIMNLNEYVFLHGQLSFFRKKNWKKKLFDFVTAFQGHELGAYEDEDEQYRSIRYEIMMSKKAIESKIGSTTVSHFAYPWFERGLVTEKILRAVGFKTSVIGLSPERNANLIGSSPYSLCRVSGDFIEALPGNNRSGFYKIMLKKMFRRLSWGYSA